MLSHLVIMCASPIQVPLYRVRGSSVRFITGITVSGWSGAFNADPITTPPLHSAIGWNKAGQLQQFSVASWRHVLVYTA